MTIVFKATCEGSVKQIYGGHVHTIKFIRDPAKTYDGFEAELVGATLTLDHADVAYLPEFEAGAEYTITVYKTAPAPAEANTAADTPAEAA